ncbi:hypothetical protein B0H21DRAFT_802116 [Amylocystis lapponica]|nr:hypothetical protein B0H21DRAFT_802116 [Amylocystis lapponica]
MPPPSPPSSTHNPSPPPPPADPTPQPPSHADEPQQCQWVDCDSVFPDPETLYNHLCNDHIGRKSTGNLCLTCKWKDCGTTCAKRDHITSHLRVHTPLKPHVCVICKKPFKRPQDLKKHEKIHTEEHHAQHKHSKAITVDAVYSSRGRSNSSADTQTSSQAHSHHTPRVITPPSISSVRVDAVQVPVPRAKSNLVSTSNDSAGVLPTPSPELNHNHNPIHYQDASSSGSRNNLYRPQSVLPTWEVLATDGSTSRSAGATGSKRSYEYSVDDFFTDVKKRRVNPAYDPHMAARLNTLAYQQSLSTATAGHQPPGHPMFPPRSVSFDINSPEELAAVNDFLITLGRDVAHGGNPAQQQQPQSLSHAPGPTADDAIAQSYFDTAGLTHLGLAGMPGIPTAHAPGSGAGYHGDSGYLSVDFSAHHLPPVYPNRTSHRSVQSAQMMYSSEDDVGSHPGSLYPSVQYSSSSRARSSVSPPTDDIYTHPAASSAYPGQQPYQALYQHPHYLTPPLDNSPHSGASPLSSHSSLSTPSNTTPPHIHEGYPHESTATFDYLRSNRPPPPVAQLAPMHYTGKTMRTTVPLQSVPNASTKASRPAPIEPKLGAGGVHRGPPARLTAAAVSSLSSTPLALTPSPSSPTLSSHPTSLYPLISGDERYKLPPLAHKYRSPSPLLDSPLSRATTLSPDPQHERERTPTPVLPPLRSLAPRRRDSEELARAVGRIELDTRREISPADRRAHARLLRDLLVSINAEYRGRFGRAETRDVEMTVA